MGKNNVRKDELHDLIFYKTSAIKIICFSKTLKYKIEELISAFFIVTNFGNRQSKGFGGYLIDNTQEDFVLQILKEEFDFVYQKSFQSDSGGYKSLFEGLLDDYSLMKTGKNNPYVKSKMFRYFVSNHSPVRWEKRSVKRDIYGGKMLNIRLRNNNDENVPGEITLKNDYSPIYDNSTPSIGNWTDPERYDYRFIRALLGLAETFEYLANHPSRSRVKYVIEVKSRNGFDRFRSPLLFKIINNNIFIVGKNKDVEPILSSLTDIWFDFKLKVRVGKRVRDTPALLLTALKTPNRFDLAAFVDFALNDDADSKINGYDMIKNKSKS